jgi:hypothetical protein
VQARQPIVVAPGQGHRVGNVEFLARTADTPRFTVPGTFVLVPPGVEHGFRNDGERAVRMLNIHAPAGFDRRMELVD